MKKIFNLRSLFMASIAVSLVILAAGSMEPDSDDPGNFGDNPLDKVEGIISVKSEIGDWDAAYLSKEGYFCFSNNLNLGKEDESQYNTLSYLAPESTDIVSIISKKDGNIPTQMKIKEGMVYFSFPNDSILELLLDNGTNLDMIDSISYKKSSLPGIANSDSFKAILANVSSLLNNGGNTLNKRPASLDKIAQAFKRIGEMSYVTDDEYLATISKTSDGNYSFSITMSDLYEKIMQNDINNVLSLWTGKATFKVGGSSCTLSGTIWCTSDIFNLFGSYGILCDTDPSNLTLGNAEYQGTGFQGADDLSYSVDFRGFKPNTTYYYRAYYHFNSDDHGGLISKYGNLDAVIYDTTIKSFTTGENILSVDVVMCIDVTGSMSGIINTVKRNAIEFYDLFNASCVEEGIQLSSLNTQVISFRDKNVDGDSWLEISPTFTLPSQQSDYNTYVNGLYANGGGDTPESGLEALDVAFSKTDWGEDDGYHRQVVILWTDAPYLVGEEFTSLQLSDLETKWNTLPSGRRMIIFAPYGSGDYNGASWGNLDDWKNVIHEDDLVNGFNNFEYILKSIIGELTSKGKDIGKAPKKQATYFNPNN